MSLRCNISFCIFLSLFYDGEFGSLGIFLGYNHRQLFGILKFDILPANFAPVVVSPTLHIPLPRLLDSALSCQNIFTFSRFWFWLYVSVVNLI